MVIDSGTVTQADIQIIGGYGKGGYGERGLGYSGIDAAVSSLEEGGIEASTTQVIGAYGDETTGSFGGGSFGGISAGGTPSIGSEAGVVTHSADLGIAAQSEAFVVDGYETTVVSETSSPSASLATPVESTESVQYNDFVDSGSVVGQYASPVFSLDASRSSDGAWVMPVSAFSVDAGEVSKVVSPGGVTEPILSVLRGRELTTTLDDGFVSSSFTTIRSSVEVGYSPDIAGVSSSSAWPFSAVESPSVFDTGDIQPSFVSPEISAVVSSVSDSGLVTETETTIRTSLEAGRSPDIGEAGSLTDTTATPTASHETSWVSSRSVIQSSEVSSGGSEEVTTSVGDAFLASTGVSPITSNEVGRSPDLLDLGYTTAVFSKSTVSFEEIFSLGHSDITGITSSVSAAVDTSGSFDEATLSDVSVNPIWSTEVRRFPGFADLGGVSLGSVSPQSSSERLWQVDEGECVSTTSVSSTASESLTVSDVGVVGETAAEAVYPDSVSAAFENGSRTYSSVSSSETTEANSTLDRPIPLEAFGVSRESTQELTEATNTGKITEVSGSPTLGVERSDSPEQFDVGIVTPTTAASPESVEGSSAYDTGDKTYVDGYAQFADEEPLSVDLPSPVSGFSESVEALTVPNVADGGAVSPGLVTPITEFELTYSDDLGSVTGETGTPSFGVTSWEKLDYDGGSVTPSFVGSQDASEATLTIDRAYPLSASGLSSASTETSYTEDGGRAGSVMASTTESPGNSSTWDDAYVSETVVDSLETLDVSRMTDSGGVYPVLFDTPRSFEVSRSYDASGVSSGMSVPLTPTSTISYIDAGDMVIVGSSTPITVVSTHTMDSGAASVGVFTPTIAEVRSGSVDIIRLIERTIGWSVEEQNREMLWSVVQEGRPVEWDIEEDERFLET